jgi:hypothetical protein
VSGGDHEHDGDATRIRELEALVASMRAELQVLRDIEAIKRMKAAYCRAFDTKDWDAWSRLLTDDVVLVTDAGTQSGRDAVLAMVQTVDASVVHNTHSPEITVTGPDTATGTWRNEDWVRVDLGDQHFAFHGCGIYDEDYVRTAEGWKVARSAEQRLRVDPIEGSSPLPGAPPG